MVLQGRGPDHAHVHMGTKLISSKSLKKMYSEVLTSVISFAGNILVTLTVSEPEGYSEPF